MENHMIEINPMTAYLPSQRCTSPFGATAQGTRLSFAMGIDGVDARTRAGAANASTALVAHVPASTAWSPPIW